MRPAAAIAVAVPTSASRSPNRNRLCERHHVHHHLPIYPNFLESERYSKLKTFRRQDFHNLLLTTTCSTRNTSMLLISMSKVLTFSSKHRQKSQRLPTKIGVFKLLRCNAGTLNVASSSTQNCFACSIIFYFALQSRLRVFS